VDKSRADRTAAQSRKKTRTAREAQGSAAIASTSGYPLTHQISRSVQSPTSRNRSLPTAALPGLPAGVRPAIRSPTTRRHPKSRNLVFTSDRPSGGRCVRDLLVTSMGRAADTLRGKSSSGHRTGEPVAELSTPLPWDDCGYGHTTGAREYRPPGARMIHSGHVRWFIHSCTQLIGPGSGDTTRSARPAWPGHRRRTYPPLGGAADRVARNGVRSDVGRLCQTPGAAGPDFRPPHRPPRRWRSRRSGIHGGSTAVDPH
jgi:hypothetical protein